MCDCVFVCLNKDGNDLILLLRRYVFFGHLLIGLYRGGVILLAHDANEKCNKGSLFLWVDLRPSQPDVHWLFSLKPQFNTNKVAHRQYDDLSIFSWLQKTFCQFLACLHVCLLPWPSHFLTGLSECCLPQRFFACLHYVGVCGCLCVCERDSQRQHNPPSLLVVCYLQLIRLVSDFSSV